MVITGGSRGLGLALANEFVSLGDQVVIAARDEAACAAAVRQLQQHHPQSQVHQTTCDVTQPDQMQHLAAFAKEKLGQIDIWVNNAGSSQIPKAPLADTATEQIQRIVGTNVLGTLLGSQAAIQIMRTQASGDASSAEPAHALEAWQVAVLMPSVMSTDCKSTFEASLFPHLCQP